MNYKYWVSFIAFILLGFLSMGNPGKQVHLHLLSGDYIIYDTGAIADDLTAEPTEQAVIRCNLPAKRQSKIKSRFRAVSFIQLSPNETNQLVSSICSYRSIKMTYGINTAHLRPFYYIFLFRLTPF
ncbi:MULTISPECIES: hypothetical protein [Niastella]|uniref:Uncharacterized protein n=1 Tax=Niastella soli TaxID=2821487 RepID=A0ABS3YRS2_9BACT|nr:hypothetical protein [Niastella soli]MBO9200544.1 hypothetical protein [Niastella soli]